MLWTCASVGDSALPWPVLALAGLKAFLCAPARASALPDPAPSYMAGTQGVGTRKRLPTVLKPLSELVSAAERRASNNRPAMV